MALPVVLLKIKDLTLDQAFQVRTAIDKAWVESLAQAYAETPELVPPIVVYQLPDGRLVVVDGFHRTRGAQSRKMKEIRAIVRPGTIVEAQDAAAEANAKATQRPLTHKERRAVAIGMALRHPDWAHKKIGERLGMSIEAVDKIEQAERVLRVVDANRNITIADTTARAIGEADQAVWVPLARAVTGNQPASKEHRHWRAADVEKVVVALRALSLAEQDILLGRALKGGWDAAHTVTEIELLAAVIEDAPAVEEEEAVDTEEEDDDEAALSAEGGDASLWLAQDHAAAPQDVGEQHEEPTTGGLAGVLPDSAPVEPADAGANGGEPLELVSPLPKVITLEHWKTLSPAEGTQALAQRGGKDRFNDQDTKGIEWARWSWNPVTGCLHGCSYCYAREFAERAYTHKFVPAFIPQRLGAPKTMGHPPAQAAHDMAYKNVFTCSMADLFGKWVPREWIQAVLDVVAAAPEWNFLFLTKFPLRLAEFEFPDNAWVGTTVDAQARIPNAEKAFANVTAAVKWLSCEPMLERLTFQRLDLFDWVVIGGASAQSQTPDFRPPFPWIAHLLLQAEEAGCQVYMKDNLLTRVRDYPGAAEAAPVVVQDHWQGRRAQPVDVAKAFKMGYLQRDVVALPVLGPAEGGAL